MFIKDSSPNCKVQHSGKRLVSHRWPFIRSEQKGFCDFWAFLSGFCLAATLEVSLKWPVLTGWTTSCFGLIFAVFKWQQICSPVSLKRALKWASEICFLNTFDRSTVWSAPLKGFAFNNQTSYPQCCILRITLSSDKWAFFCLCGWSVLWFGWPEGEGWSGLTAVTTTL